jgi:hypothetical protein
MSSDWSRRLQVGIVFGLCASGMSSAQRTPSAVPNTVVPAPGRIIKDCPDCP